MFDYLDLGDKSLKELVEMRSELEIAIKPLTDFQRRLDEEIKKKRIAKLKENNE